MTVWFVHAFCVLGAVTSPSLCAAPFPVLALKATRRANPRARHPNPNLNEQPQRHSTPSELQHLSTDPYRHEHTLLYLQSREEHKHENVVETVDRDSAGASKFRLFSLMMTIYAFLTFTHMEVSKLGQSHPSKHIYFGQIIIFFFFGFASFFSFSGKIKKMQMIFL